MKLAGNPRAINSPLVDHVCAYLCHPRVLIADSEAPAMWKSRNEELLGRILWAVERDPGRCVLVAVDCRGKHWLREKLRSVPGVQLVDYWRLQETSGGRATSQPTLSVPGAGNHPCGHRRCDERTSDILTEGTT